MLLLMFYLFLESPELVRIFPTDEDMEKDDFAMMLATDFRISDQKIYVVDQLEHQVHLFALNGDYLMSYGRYGMGPGELNWPRSIDVSNKYIVVKDRFMKYQIFDKDFNYLKRTGIMLFIDNWALLDDQTMFLQISNLQDNTYFFEYNLEGKRINAFQVDVPGDLPSGVPPEKRAYSTIKVHGEKVYCLSQYLPILTIFESNRHTRTRLHANLDVLPEYTETGFLYMFQSFDVLGDHLVACFPTMGRLSFMVFDLKGRPKQRYSVTMPVGERTYSALNMSFIRREGELWLYVLINGPGQNFALIKWPQS